MLTSAARQSLRLSSKYAAPRAMASRGFTIGDSFKNKVSHFTPSIQIAPSDVSGCGRRRRKSANAMHTFE